MMFSSCEMALVVMRQMLILWLLSLLLQFTSPQTHLVWYLFALCQRTIEVKEPANLFRLAASVLLMVIIMNQ
ncbi:hypothetical protein ACVRE7_004763 [Escherichia coli]|uniref:hypothetical protein n=1 Tax=Escherichia TaxID=561 RepID=UPI0017C99471|nr:MULTISPECIES: hypothetical protein [Escherichia]EFG7120594.1 hypothetical protein [Escherichia coli]EFH3153068.1 hypothetical protein [Escherichia coli]EFH3616393.1 hypothetical protein [Escherichia coli]EFK3605522.1 hypothetical protein [Escherichia coli]EFV2011181.1 hypothetical protein [Escherichia coli]